MITTVKSILLVFVLQVIASELAMRHTKMNMTWTAVMPLSGRLQALPCAIRRVDTLGGVLCKQPHKRPPHRRENPPPSTPGQANGSPSNTSPRGKDKETVNRLLRLLSSGTTISS